MKQSSVLLIPLACFIGVVAFGVFQYVSYRKLKKRQLEQEKVLEKQTQEREKERRAREGLRGRIFKDKEVPATEWRPEWNRPGRDIEWLEGELRELLSGDIVLEWDFYPHPAMWRHGYAIERNGRIVAEVITAIS